MKTIKQLYRLQSSSLRTMQQRFGHYTGAKFYNTLHSKKCNGNIILLCLHLSGSEVNQLLSSAGLPENTKLTKLVTI
jgi:hypothetical protein